MSRFVVLPGAAIVLGAVVLTGCSTNGAGNASSATPTAASAKVVQVASQKKVAADPLAALARKDFASVLLTPAQAAASAPKMTRHNLAGTRGHFTGKGASCTALASFMNNSGILNSVAGNAVATSYDNIASTEAPARQRTIGQSIEATPTKDAAAQLSRYRSAAAGCSTPLTDKDGDGTQYKVELLPSPKNMGAQAMALKLTMTSQYFNLTTNMDITASGHNAMAVATTGHTAQQRAAISSQAWKNLTARP